MPLPSMPAPAPTCRPARRRARSPRSLRPRPVLAAATVVVALGLSGCGTPERAATDGSAAGRTATPGQSVGSDATTAPASASPSTTTGRAGAPGSAAPDAQTRQQAERAVAEMTLEEKAGQVLVATWDGADQTAVAAQVDQIEDLHLGGVIVMGSNEPTETGQGPTAQAGAGGGAHGVQVEAMAAQNRTVAAALADGRDWPGVISVDQEGGPVTRLGAPLTRWPAAATVGAVGDPALTRQAASGLGSELAGLGFTMTHAPVADVTTPGDAVIRERAYGNDPREVSEHVVAAVEGLSDAGMLSSPKHFPGHGSVTTDSHVGLPVQERTPQALAETDWAPFRAAAQAGAPSIMVGHIAVSAWDPAVPATLQPKAYQALREQIGFDGVAVTDALNMGAVVDVVGVGRPVDTGVRTPAGAALQAGADLLLMPEDERAAHADIVQAVQSGAIPQERLDEAAARVVAMQLAWAQRSEDPPVPPAEPGSHRDLAARLERG